MAGPLLCFTLVGADAATPASGPTGINGSTTVRTPGLARAVDSIVGDELPVTHPTYASALGWQDAPAIAWNGDQFLAAWDDEDSGVRAARVGANGAIVGPEDGFDIYPESANQAGPAVAWGGGQYLLAWVSGNDRVEAVRITEDGEVLDTRPIEIYAGPRNAWYVSIAWNGTNFLVTWSTYENYDGDVVATRVSPAGTVLDPGGIEIAVSSRNDGITTVASDGDQWLVVWTSGPDDGSDILGARVSASGAVLDEDGSSSPGLQGLSGSRSSGGTARRLSRPGPTPGPRAIRSTSTPRA